jgi:predicted Rossmann fold flavoprotein
MIYVIGGGAAGIIAAWRLASRGVPVTILEKKHRLGTKILISGGGKCNVTHDGEMRHIRQKFRQNEANFLKTPFYHFTNKDFTALLTEKGLPLYTRPDGRIFPVPPADAKDVVDALESQLADVGVKVWREAPVERIDRLENGTGWQITLDDEGEQKATVLTAEQIVIAVGGSSYPATGCTGDGWRWLRELGHTIVPLRAALAPLYLTPTPPETWSGIAIRDCVLKARALNADNTTGKERMRWRGDLLFTHKGVSGPTALGVSREIAEAFPENSIAEVDIIPDKPYEAVRDELLHYTKTYPRRGLADWLTNYLPHRLVEPFLATAGVSMEIKGAYLPQKERNRLIETVKGWNIGTVRNVPLERGEVVAGGVSLDEVNSQTMESLLFPGLYLCGEVLDIAGPVGGYNLQAAWSTGYIAGEAIANEVLKP